MGMDPITIAAIGGAAGLGSAYLDSQSRSDATQSAMDQKAASQAFIQKQIDQARADIFKLFPSAQDSRQQGLQAGLNLYSQALPQMLNTYQQGNVGAQNTLLAGLPQMNNAILGKPVSYAGLQPMQLQQPTLNMPQLNPQQIAGLGLGGQPANAGT